MTSLLVSRLLHNGDLETLYDMIDKGANLDHWLEQNTILWIIYNLGKFPSGILRLALTHCYYDTQIITTLLNFIIDTDDFVNLQIITQYITDLSNYNVLFNACSHGNRKIIYNLISHNADINYRSPDGKNLIHVLICNNHYSILHDLLKSGKISHLLNLMDDYGDTPIFNAVKMGSTTMTKLLLDYGANPILVDRAGWSLLHLYIMWLNTHQAEDIDIVEMLYTLIGHGCDIDYRNHNLTPYLLCANYQELITPILQY